MSEEMIVDGFLFATKEEYQRAKREKETIAYLKANMDNSDMKALLRVYNRSVDKGSFQTVIGQQFLYQLRERLVGSQVVSADTLAPIRIGTRQDNSPRQEQRRDNSERRYKKMYEETKTNQKIKNLLIAVMAFVIVGMLIITATTRYSIFTYFTDYEEKIRNQVEDEMEDWQSQLETKEKELAAKQEQLDQATAMPETD